MYYLFIICILYCSLHLRVVVPQTQIWRNGILIDEFIFENGTSQECHASTIAETKAGLVSAWFGGTREGYDDVVIYMSRKENDTWTTPIQIADGVQNDTFRYPSWNPVLYQIPDGDLLLFYKFGSHPSTWKGWMKSSNDSGYTWSEPKQLPEGFLGPIKNKPILLNNGNLICPSSTEGNGWKVHFELTPDFGKSWRKVSPETNENSTALRVIQPTILRHNNQTLQALCRSENRIIVESWSFDNGETWSPLTKSTLPNNNSGFDSVTLNDGLKLLVYNHVWPPENQTKGERTPLNVAVSYDGNTWYATLILEDASIGQYSYPSVIQTDDGMVHIVYTWKRLRIKYVLIDPKSLILAKIENGVWPQLSPIN